MPHVADRGRITGKSEVILGDPITPLLPACQPLARDTACRPPEPQPGPHTNRVSLTGEPSSTVCAIVLDGYATQKGIMKFVFCGGTCDSFRLQSSQLRFIASFF